MKNTLEKIAFFGSGPVAAASLKALANNFVVELVITKSVPDHHKGPVAPVERLATDLELPIVYANNKSELDDIVDCLNLESNIGVLVDYGVMISQSAINKFPLGIINSHFSLLPEWRGADPITFSLLSGQTKTGVSLMIIEPTLDTGKLIARRSISIDSHDTIVILTDKLVSFSNSLLIEFLPKYIAGSLKPKRQPHPEKSTYSRKLTKSDGQIKWEKSAAQIEREIRAYSGWPKSYTTIDDKKLIIINARALDIAENDSNIKCGDGKYIAIDNIIAPSGKKMSFKDYLNGQKNK